MISRICGPIKMTYVISITEFRKCFSQTIKAFTMFFTALTKFLINPNLMCSDGNKILAVDFWHTFPLEMSFLAWANP